MTATVLVTGAGGQLGTELQRADWPATTRVSALTSAELDISDPDAVAKTVKQIQPTVIVNAAAYTAVDAAEDNEALAFAVNDRGVANLAAAANVAGARLLHVSTDYVFDGTSERWYTENDDTSPLGVYGRSKLAGERHALAADNGVVLRTAWVYSSTGANFIKTMIRLAAERDELGVVADQRGCPTSAADIAVTIVALHDRDLRPEQRLLHVAAPDEATWHQLAMFVLGQPDVRFTGTVNPLTTAEYPTRAQRPANSRLSTERLVEVLGSPLPSWRESVTAVVAELTQ